MQSVSENNILTKIAYQCAPVCVGIKPSNLLNISNQDCTKLPQTLEKTGLNALCLYEYNDKQIILIYREYLLKNYLRITDVILFLNCYGYSKDFLDNLRRLRERFEQFYHSKGEFPHEIGAFLGYPISDVKKFVQYKGKECLFTGYWKVYDNLESAKAVFAQYNYVRKVALKAVAKGESLCELYDYNIIHK